MLEQNTNHLYLERDLQIARDIQKSFLPTTLPQCAGWEIEAHFLPARMVSGDFYDAFFLTNQRRVGVVIADVCDKGVGAALFMALFRTLVRAFAQQHYTLSWADLLDADKPESGERRTAPSIGMGALKNAVQLTNNYVVENHGTTGMFATLFFGVLDPSNGGLLYVNAGHNPPFITDGLQIKEELKPCGPAIGLIPNAMWEIRQTHLALGDTLLAFTDGVTEARNTERGFFGEERLQTCLCAGQTSAKGYLNRLAADLSGFVGEAPQSDDITLLAVHRALS